jgi:hypothetical protein
MRAPLATAEIEEATGQPDPLAEAIRRADLAALWAAIEELPHQQRDALLLREFGGLSYNELAAALAVTTPAVESLLFRARRSLRARLEPVYGALSGASWAEALARLVGGSAPAVATKTVALGLGAAAATGGALVAPQLLDRPHRAPPPTRSLSHLPAPPTRLPAAPPAPAPVRHRLVLFHGAPAREWSHDGSEPSHTEQDDPTERAATARDRPTLQSGDSAEIPDTTDSNSAAAGGDPTPTAQPASETSGQNDGSDTSSPSGNDASVTATTTVLLANTGDGTDGGD